MAIQREKLSPAVIGRRDPRRRVDGDRRQHEADGGDDGAGQDRRHEALDPAVPGNGHDDADQGVERARRDDAAEGEADIGVGRADARARRREHRADEGEARAEIARHPPADDGEEDQGGDAGEQDRDVRIEAHEEGCEDGGAEHGDHVLQPDHDGRAGRQPLLRHDDAFGLEAPARKEAVLGRHDRPLFGAWRSLAFVRDRPPEAPDPLHVRSIGKLRAEHAAEKWKPLFGNSRLNSLESITFMRFDRFKQNAS